MALEPKIIDHPGAGKIQEMTLDQYLSPLDADHLARKQLEEIRNQALASVELSTQLMQANEKVLELQNRLMSATATINVPRVYVGDPPGSTGGLGSSPNQSLLSVPPAEIHAPPNKYVPAQDLIPATPPAVPAYSDAKCPNCGDMVSTRPATWGSHQARKHPDNRAPRPT